MRELLRQALCAAEAPVLQRLDVSLAGSAETVLSGPNLWSCAVHRRHAWRASGVTRGAVIFDQSTDTLEALINFVACVIGDFIYAPLPPRSPTQSAATAQVSLHAEFLVGEGDRELPTRVEDPYYDLSFVPQEFRGVILGSSGTSTGARTPVALSWEILTRQIEIHRCELPAEIRSTRLCVLPHFHAFGLILDLLLGLASRQTLLLRQAVRPSPRALLNDLARYQVRELALVPRLLELLCNALEEQPSLRHGVAGLMVHVGGAPVLSSLLNRARQYFRRVIVGYGLTEAGPGVMLDDRVVCGDIKLQVILSISSLKQVCIASPCLGLFPGKAQRLSDGFLATGDLARVSAGRIEVCGRMGEAVKTMSGEWTTVTELENALMGDFSPRHLSLGFDTKRARWVCTIVHSEQNRARNRERLERFLEVRFGDAWCIEDTPLSEPLVNALIDGSAKSVPEQMRRNTLTQKPERRSS